MVAVIARAESEAREEGRRGEERGEEGRGADAAAGEMYDNGSFASYR